MNFKLIRGDDQFFVLKFKQAGVVKDITGWTIFFTLKKNQDDADSAAVIKKTITSHADPTQGETEFRIAASETDPLQGIYYYDVQYKNTSGNVGTAHRARASNVATIGTSADHSLAVGDEIVVSGIGGSGYNGTWTVVSVPDNTHFTFANTGGDETETVDTGGTITHRNIKTVMIGTMSFEKDVTRRIS